MKNKVIKIKEGASVAPYSPAVRYGNLLFLSGQTADTNGTIEEETKAAMEHIKEIVEANGSTMSDIIRCQIFLRNGSDFAAMNGVYKTFFDAEEGYPSRFCTYNADLYGGLLVEIDAIVAVED